MTEVVLFNELDTESGKKIAVITLNSEKSLNALSLEMIKLIAPRLEHWSNDDDIAVVMVQGAGDKAFCAGGDVVDLYHACVDTRTGQIANKVVEFFSEEYQLDYMIHTYEKPILLWGHGIVMGGGLGLMAGASHRVVTDKSRIAMPEITIGLYPDVGGSYFLNRMPDGCGLFLGLTGASINAIDAVYVNLADHCVLAENKSKLVEQLIQTNWGNTTSLNHQKLSDVLTAVEKQDKPHMPQGNLYKHGELIRSLANCHRVESAVVNILDEQTDDKWFNKAQASLSHGSPLSAHLVMQQLQKGRDLTLAQCFQMELGLSVQCASIGEFPEGVRALLIDKDLKPNWKYQTVHDVNASFVDSMFVSPWSEHDHPLKNLTNKEAA